MEYRPLAERMQDLGRLSKEFGGAEAIPETALVELQYARETDEEGVVHLVPFEKLAAEGLAAAQGFSTVEQAARREAGKAPFEQMALNVATKAGFTGANLQAFENKLDHELSKIEHYGWSGVAYGGLDFLPEDSPVHIFKDIDIRGATESGATTYLFHGTFEEVYFGDMLEKALDAFREDRDDWYIACLDHENAERLSDEASEKMWNYLERLKSKLTDMEVLETSFAERFDEFMVATENLMVDVMGYEASDFDIDHPLHIPVTATETRPEPDRVRYGELPSGTGTQLRRDQMARMLRDDKFPDVAERLAGCKDIPEMRAVLKDAAGSNAMAAQYKAAEKTLMAGRKTLQSQEEIEAFNVELHRLRDAKKRDLRLLRGAAEYLDLPRLFAQYTKARIMSAQDILKAGAKADGTVDITLDGRPDEKRDANPGRVSGDCTENEPLPFGTKIPAHNLKIFKDGSHVGNIYLLKTTAQEHPATAEMPYPVWHLDAIQFPSYTVDQTDFISKLVTGLAEEAAKQKVQCITVNTASYQISNYDYIARAVLGYLGAQKTDAITYDHMQMPDEDIEDAVSVSADKVKVHFPERLPGHKQFQGEGSRQYVLWRNPAYPSQEL